MQVVGSVQVTKQATKGSLEVPLLNYTMSKYTTSFVAAEAKGQTVTLQAVDPFFDSTGSQRKIAVESTPKASVNSRVQVVAATAYVDIRTTMRLVDKPSLLRSGQVAVASFQLVDGKAVTLPSFTVAVQYDKSSSGPNSGIRPVCMKVVGTKMIFDPYIYGVDTTPHVSGSMRCIVGNAATIPKGFQYNEYVGHHVDHDHGPHVTLESIDHNHEGTSLQALYQRAAGRDVDLQATSLDPVVIVVGQEVAITPILVSARVRERTFDAINLQFSINTNIADKKLNMGWDCEGLLDKPTISLLAAGSSKNITCRCTSYSYCIVESLGNLYQIGDPIYIERYTLFSRDKYSKPWDPVAVPIEAPYMVPNVTYTGKAYVAIPSCVNVTIDSIVSEGSGIYDLPGGGRPLKFLWEVVTDPPFEPITELALTQTGYLLSIPNDLIASPTDIFIKAFFINVTVTSWFGAGDKGYHKIGRTSSPIPLVDIRGPPVVFTKFDEDLNLYGTVKTDSCGQSDSIVEYYWRQMDLNMPLLTTLLPASAFTYADLFLPKGTLQNPYNDPKRPIDYIMNLSVVNNVRNLDGTRSPYRSWATITIHVVKTFIPRVINATFSDSLTMLNIYFNQSTNLFGENELVAFSLHECDPVIMPRSLKLLGVGPQCMWKSTTNYIILMGSQFSVRNIQAWMAPNEGANLLLLRPFKLQDDSGMSDYAGGSSIIARIFGPSNFPVAQAVITGSERVGKCDGFDLSGATSEGSAALRLSYKWSLDLTKLAFANPAQIKNMTDYLELANAPLGISDYTGQSEISMPRLMLPPSDNGDQMYFLTLTVTSWLGETHSVTRAFSRSKYDIPRVQLSFATGSPGNIYVPAVTALRANALPSGCAPPGSFSVNLLFAWSVVESNPYDSVHMETINKALVGKEGVKITIPEMTLRAGYTYTFMNRVQEPDAVESNTATIKFTVEYSALTAKILGGTRKVEDIDDLVLNATESVDPDTRNNKDMAYQWSCSMLQPLPDGKRDPCFDEVAFYKLPTVKTMVLRVPSSMLVSRSPTIKDGVESNPLVFTVIVSKTDGKTQTGKNGDGTPIYKAGRDAAASANIMITNLRPPKVSIDNLPTLKMDHRGKTRISASITGDYDPSRWNASWNCITKNFDLSPEGLDTRIATSIDSLDLVIYPMVLQPLDVDYTFAYRVESLIDPTVFGEARYSFRTNSYPSGGKCFAEPSRQAYNESFTLNCQDWSDDPADYPLQYQFELFEGDTKTMQFGAFSTLNVIKVIVPEGNPEAGYQHTMRAFISDKRGAYVYAYFNLTSLPLQISDEEKSSQAGGLMDNLVAGSSKVKDSNSLAQGIASAASLLTGAGSMDPEAKNSMRGSMIGGVEGTTGGLPNPDDVSRSAQMVGKVASSPADMDNSLGDSAITSMSSGAGGMVNGTNKPMPGAAVGSMGGVFDNVLSSQTASLNARNSSDELVAAAVVNQTLAGRETILKDWEMVNYLKVYTVDIPGASSAYIQNQTLIEGPSLLSWLLGAWSLVIQVAVVPSPQITSTMLVSALTNQLTNATFIRAISKAASVKPEVITNGPVSEGQTSTAPFVNATAEAIADAARLSTGNKMLGGLDAVAQAATKGSLSAEAPAVIKTGNLILSHSIMESRAPKLVGDNMGTTFTFPKRSFENATGVSVVSSFFISGVNMFGFAEKKPTSMSAIVSFTALDPTKPSGRIAVNTQTKYIEIVIPKKKDNPLCTVPNCRFWNEDTKKWSSSGCYMFENTAEKTICRCNHLTSFNVNAKSVVPKVNVISMNDLLSLTPENIAKQPMGFVVCFIIMSLGVYFLRSASVRDRIIDHEGLISMYRQAERRARLGDYYMETENKFTKQRLKDTDEHFCLRFGYLGQVFLQKHAWTSVLYRQNTSAFTSTDRLILLIATIFSSLAASAVFLGMGNIGSNAIFQAVITSVVVVPPLTILQMCFSVGKNDRLANFFNEFYEKKMGLKSSPEEEEERLKKLGPWGGKDMLADPFIIETLEKMHPMPRLFFKIKLIVLAKVGIDLTEHTRNDLEMYLSSALRKQGPKFVLEASEPEIKDAWDTRTFLDRNPPKKLFAYLLATGYIGFCNLAVLMFAMQFDMGQKPHNFPLPTDPAAKLSASCPVSKEFSALPNESIGKTMIWLSQALGATLLQVFINQPISIFFTIVFVIILVSTCNPEGVRLRERFLYITENELPEEDDEEIDEFDVLAKYKQTKRTLNKGGIDAISGSKEKDAATKASGGKGDKTLGDKSLGFTKKGKKRHKGWHMEDQDLWQEEDFDSDDSRIDLIEGVAEFHVVGDGEEDDYDELAQDEFSPFQVELGDPTLDHIDLDRTVALTHLMYDDKSDASMTATGSHFRLETNDDYEDSDEGSHNSGEESKASIEEGGPKAGRYAIEKDEDQDSDVDGETNDAQFGIVPGAIGVEIQNPAFEKEPRGRKRSL